VSFQKADTFTAHANLYLFTNNWIIPGQCYVSKMAYRFGGKKHGKVYGGSKGIRRARCAWASVAWMVKNERTVRQRVAEFYIRYVIEELAFGKQKSRGALKGQTCMGPGHTHGT
jgi:hypothetical protein